VGLALRELASALTRQAKFAEAVQVTGEALDILRSAYGDDNLSVIPWSFLEACWIASADMAKPRDAVVGHS